jgi:hypothetical protein
VVFLRDAALRGCADFRAPAIVNSQFKLQVNLKAFQAKKR